MRAKFMTMRRELARIVSEGGTSGRLAGLGSIALVLALFAQNMERNEGPKAQSIVSPEPSLQLTSPGPTGVATYNQALGPKAFTVHIDDDAMRVRAERRTFVGRAPGLRSVAIVVNDVWTIAVPDPGGRFAVDVDLSKAARGPLVVDVYGWDVPPDNRSYKVSINLRIQLFVDRESKDLKDDDRPPGHPAKGRRLVFNEPFDRLSRDVWHAGAKPDGQEYGAAAFLGYDSAEANPYKVMDGFLRLRATHRPDRADPAGWNRKWVTGHLSTGFPDGSTSAAYRKGYFEARMLLPRGAGSWPSFWLLDQHGIRNSAADGAVEIDVIEGYGHSPTSYVATIHDWPPPSANGKGYVRAQRNITDLPDGTVAFHDYGVEITDDMVIFYYDGVEKLRAPLYRKDLVSPFFLMLGMSMSHDWPITVPPSGSYDLWVDHVRVYE